MEPVAPPRGCGRKVRGGRPARHPPEEAGLPAGHLMRTRSHDPPSQQRVPGRACSGAMATRRGPYPDTAPFLSQADETEEAAGGPRAGEQPEGGVQAVTGISHPRSVMMVTVLCYINLLNYMDRFTVAGILPDIESFFRIGDSSSGLLQTVFICSYMVLAPIFGYLGDRYHRKRLLCLGIAFWSAVTLGSSFIPRERFWLLLVTRGLVGVGEASYSTIAPTIIADLFVGEQRSRMLALFYFAIPVGSGLGYIVGSKVKDLAEDWHWALRVTPALGVLAVVLLVTVLQEPPRGAVESHSTSPLRYTSWATDVRALSRNLHSLIFGVITCVTGVLGVGAGVEISKRLRRANPRADPLVCAAGLLGSAPFLFLALACAPASSIATYVFIFAGETPGETLLSLNWAIVADILLYVVVPTRRSTAEAFQIVLSHLLGDAGSPYLIGVISDRLQWGRPPSYLLEFHSLQHALMLSAFAGALGGAFFLATALFVQADRKRAELGAQGLLPEEAETEEPIVVPQRGRSTKVPVSSVLI
ncbi:protein spinster homolog 1 isoform X2 [Pelodiscus sinensis]|uniref:protein spinster homolog 1 isoform X2 n=1 Tax=Pelodiscus sinensis TaxID=13735 RepID=UPI003F6C47A2